MVHEATKIDSTCIVHEIPDTERTPDSGTSTVSRQTVVTGEAAKRAAEKLAAALAHKKLAGVVAAYNVGTPINIQSGSSEPWVSCAPLTCRRVR
jgi:CO/xanthine dehydrogenase Mo-binding subunit